MKFLVLLWCIGCWELINADCTIDELDIVVAINRYPKRVCSFRNERFNEGRSVRECNIDCTCSVGRLTCCSKSKTYCQRVESCQKVIFDFNTSVFSRSSVVCEEKVKTKLVPVYDHISNARVKSQVVTIPPPKQVELITPAKTVKPPPENKAQRTRRLNIERIMKINRARRRNVARAQRRKAKRRQMMTKKTPVASAQVEKGRTASENVESGKLSESIEEKPASEGLTFAEIMKKNHERRLRKLRKQLSKGTAAVQGKTVAATKEEKPVSEGLTFAEIMKKNHERRLRKLRKQLSKGTAAVQSKTVAATKEEKPVSEGLTFAEIMKKNHERRLRKLRKQLSKGTAAVQSKTVAATKEEKPVSEGLTFAEIMKKNHERRLRKLRKQLSKGKAAVQSKTVAATKEENPASGNLSVEEKLRRNRGTVLNTGRSSYLLNSMKRDRMRRERRDRLRRQRLTNLNKSQ